MWSIIQSKGKIQISSKNVGDQNLTELLLKKLPMELIYEKIQNPYFLKVVYMALLYTKQLLE